MKVSTDTSQEQLMNHIGTYYNKQSQVAKITLIFYIKVSNLSKQNFYFTERVSILRILTSKLIN